MKLTKLSRLVLTAFTALALSACGGGDLENKEPRQGDLSDIQVYKADSSYRSTIAQCVRAERESDYCRLSTLPLIGMVFNDPGIPQIMDRVVVSHSWMGERFEELLYEFPQDMLPLFKGVTAIVIDADIRPAYYAPGTGAIYLDPAFLWLSVNEKQTINTKEDYRAGFDDPLAFRQLNRYLTSDGQAAYRYQSLEDNSTREIGDIILLVARLLLHELAHANDFAPPENIQNLSPNSTLIEAIEGLENNWVSSRLNNDTPLNSNTMFSLAGVMYRGNDPSIEDLEITASEVGEAFADDGASDDYAYTTEFEDLAMLFEATMMKYFFDADYELAFTSVPEDPRYCNYYQIGWGQRNRLGHESVKPRAQFAASILLPDTEFGDFFDTLDAPTEISGDWCLENVVLGQQKASRLETQQVTPADLLRPYL